MVASCKNDHNRVLLLLLGVGVVSSFVSVQSFTSPSTSIRRHRLVTPSLILTKETSSTRSFVGKRLTRRSPLYATENSAGGKKKRRRRRKKAPSSEAVVASETPPLAEAEASDNAPSEEINVGDIKDVANFSFGDSLEESPQTLETEASVPTPAVQDTDESIPLPDIKDTLRRKKMEATPGAAVENDDMMPKTKIDRKDRKALLKLLEQDPYADGDDSFFEEQEYTTVSALLGERAKPFLGIPIGPLQVGHFIGALVIVLMAFIEYPGFPLTNLPSPVRGALQGGLGTVYGINLLLAGVAALKAGERGQPAPLWIAKTFTVGGLALDQLTQLPTLQQVEAAKARKGKRALKNRRK